MTNDQTCAAFVANPSRDVRNANGTLYSRDGTLYSYGSHFPLAHMRYGLLFVNSDGYSVSTARHKRQISKAARFAGQTITQCNTAVLKRVIAA